MNILTESVKESMDRAYEILCAKNKDYSEDSDPFKNFKAAELVGLTVEQALLLQMTNKLSRVGNLLMGKEIKHESIQDTLIDLSNYAYILKAYLDQKENKS